MKVLIAAGGSGGHIFPAIALAQELERRGNTEVVFVASRRTLDKKILEELSFKKIFLSINPMPYGFSLGFIQFFIKLVFDLLISCFTLISERPNAVVGFGGYTAGAILLLAALSGIKTIIHEQNLVPGRANRYLERFVDKIGISFEKSRDYFKSGKTVFTGNPLRRNMVLQDKKNAAKLFGFDGGKFTILAIGGSQGAHSLNRLVSGAIRRLDDKITMNLQIIHITGPKDLDIVSGIYKEKGIVFKAFTFMEDIHHAYAVADLAVSRSGAAAVFELALYAIPMILIPYPFKRNSQRFNAEYFAAKGAAIYREEETLDIPELKNIIKELINNKEKLKNLSEAAKELSCPEAAKNLADEVIKLLKI